MVQLSSAIIAIDHTAAVELEHVGVSLDAHWHGLLSDRRCELVVVRLGHLDVPAWLEHRLRCLVLAKLIASLVSVVRILHDTLAHHVVVGRGQVASVTPFVAVLAAVHDLLLTECDELAGL